ncbi:succinate dehydrogenase assembly factor 2, mitochondrial-like [Convolutriloba macropyga]|uniref:succinate dehydrogenase assembly factor 2, mitochondrial-like n=1 Tax=Convolutriloba macropyga TaxID=536237 RepID=UPI003F51FFFB
MHPTIFHNQFSSYPTRSCATDAFATSETTEVLRARLLYQSRKRGIRENDLLLSTYAKVHLDSMSHEELRDYDKILNLVDNEWDLYKYIVGSEPVPEEINSETMRQLVKFASNQNREQRLFMPDLN